MLAAAHDTGDLVVVVENLQRLAANLLEVRCGSKGFQRPLILQGPVLLGGEELGALLVDEVLHVGVLLGVADEGLRRYDRLAQELGLLD